MKRQLITMIIVLSALAEIVAQKEDNIWVFGYDSNDYPEYPGRDRVTFSFDDSLSIEYENGWVMSIFETNAMVSDANGNLQLLSNGCYVEDGKGEFVQNSWGLNPGFIFDKDCLGDTSGYGANQSMMFLPDPGTDSDYSLLHVTTNVITQPVIFAYRAQLNFTQAVFDSSDNKFQILLKNQPIVLDTLHSDGFHAVRHANGRDWWIVIAKQHSNKYYITQLSPQGFEVKEQSIGPPTWSGAGGEMVFSPDGTKLARFNTRDDLRIFDFDRCTGTLSNPVYIPIADDADNELFAGLAFSADGRYLYAAEVRRVLQFDMQSPDIAGSMTIVAELENVNCPFQPALSYLELGPDGKIYCRNLNGAYCMHRINHPEREGTACEVEQNAMNFEPYAFKNLPHFPNFRLGPVNGSPCDTLGIDNHPLAGWRYERTGGLGVDFTSVSWYEPTEWHWVFGDGSAGSTERNPAHTFPAAGPYDVCLTVSNANGSDTKCKTVWVGTSSASSGPDAVSGGIRVYPNPASGFVTVQGAPSAARVRVYDRLGRLVLESALEADRFDAGALPNGMYVVQVWDERGPLVDAGHSTLVVLR